MPLVLDVITPVLQVLVTITSHVSPSKMQERAVDKEKKIATIIAENKHLFSKSDLKQLKTKQRYVLRTRKILPSTRFRDIVKNPIKVFSDTRNYSNSVDRYYVAVQAISASALSRQAFEPETASTGKAPHPQGHNIDQCALNGPAGPGTPAPGTLYVEIKDLKIVAGADVVVEVEYDEGGSFKVSFSSPSDESGRPCKGKVPRSYSVSGLAELVPGTEVGRVADLGMSMPSYSVRSITNLAITRLEDGLEDDDEDTMSFMTAYDGDGASVMLNEDGETFSILVDEGYDPNGSQISLATVDSGM